jgi:hypothetical protein
VRKIGHVFVVASALLLLSGACAQTEEAEEPEHAGHSFTLTKPPSTIEGNVVSMKARVTGIEIVKADGDTSEKTGHFHVFIDRDPVDVGEVIPKEAGIVHTTDNPIKVYGLSVGEHTLTVVIGDGTHKRFGEDLEQTATVDVKGPSVDGTAPATLDEGADLTVELKSEGVEIVKADGKRNDKTGHFHILVDPQTAPEGGDAIPAAVENKIIHTADDSATVSGLAKGEHTIWVVLGDGQHYAFDPPVMDKLTVTVG